MFTLYYYDAIMLLLNVYYAAINLSCYYAAVMLLFKVYYANIMLLLILKVYDSAILLFYHFLFTYIFISYKIKKYHYSDK